MDLVWGGIYDQSLECLKSLIEDAGKIYYAIGLADHHTQEERFLWRKVF